MVKRNAARGQPGSVRIIAGDWRGRRIPVAADTIVRPTPDRVRETVFNWLRDMIAGARCLDLFAGTGALGFEALSRGAAEVWFVEQDATLYAALGAQAEVFGARPRIVRQDAAAFLRGTPAQQFDIAFLDPPYAVPVEPLLAQLGPWLAPAALVYVERPREPGLPPIEGAQWLKRSHAGAVEYGLLEFATMSPGSTSRVIAT
jgi:16S rRNA (guanine966-N2)-methyltransferase